MKARDSARHGFTMVELLVSVAILLLVTAVTYGVFAAVTKAWQRGTALSEDLHHGDFVMEQLVMALHSAYYRDTKSGFVLEDDGDGASARDSISWVKLGPSLVGENSEIAKGPHRVRFTIESMPDSGKPAAAVTFWSPDAYLQPEGFDPEQLKPIFLSSRIVGFNCRVATNAESGELDWDDTWEKTNELPPAVELSIYLRPLQEDEDPVEMKRCVSIPIKGQPWK